MLYTVDMQFPPIGKISELSLISLNQQDSRITFGEINQDFKDESGAKVIADFANEFHSADEFFIDTKIWAHLVGLTQKEPDSIRFFLSGVFI